MWKPAPYYPFDSLTTPVPFTNLDNDLIYIGKKVVSVLDFGAIGNGIADDTAAIAEGIAYCQSLGAGSTLLFPSGTFTSTLKLLVNDVPIKLQGAGMSMGAFGTFPASGCTTIKYTGGLVAGGFVKFSGCQGGGGISNLTIDVNSLTDYDLDVDTILFGVFKNLVLLNARINGLLLQSNAASGTTCSWNRFENLLINTSNASAAGLKPACIRLTGDATTNTAHNTFDNLACNYGGTAHGVYLGNCDNNRFIGLFMNRDIGGTGHGVEVDPTELANFPVNNVFLHLQAGNGGYNEQVGTIFPQLVIGYMRDNGQPAMVGGSFNLVNPGTGIFFGKQGAGVIVGGDFDTTTAGSGLYVIRNASGATTALVLVDMGSGLCSVVLDPSGLIAVGADPGAGANVLWVTVAGTSLRVRNRFVAAKDIQVTCTTTVSTPA